MIDDSSIAITALIVQFALAFMLLASGLIQQRSFYWVSSAFMGLPFALPLLVSSEILNFVEPMLGNISLGGLALLTSIRITFILNVIWITVLIAGTGGSLYSPFVPLLLILPPLAIFLRLPNRDVLISLVLACAAFTIGFEDHRKQYAPDWPNQALLHWFIGVSCFVLTTIVGIVSTLNTVPTP